MQSSNVVLQMHLRSSQHNDSTWRHANKSFAKYSSNSKSSEFPSPSDMTSCCLGGALRHMRGFPEVQRAKTKGRDRVQPGEMLAENRDIK